MIGVRAHHPCYGYRRVHRTLTQDVKGILNHKKVQRIWRGNGMQQPAKKRRRRRGEKGQVPLQAAYANHVWTCVFVEDATQDGRKLRFLTLVDEHTRRGLAVVPRRSSTSGGVIGVLEHAFAQYGAPAFLRSGNGQFTTASPGAQARTLTTRRFSHWGWLKEWGLDTP